MAMDDKTQRRNLLKGLGVMGLAGLAGCVQSKDDSGGSGGDDGGSDGGDSGGSDTTTQESDGGSSSPDELVFGQPTVATSKWDFLQPAVTAATEMSIADVNEAGGPLGATLTLKQRETALEPQQARTVVQQFKNNDNAVVVGGLLSSEVTVLIDFLVEQEIPVVSNWIGSTALDRVGGDLGTPGDTSDDEWIWRTQISDSLHTAGAAKKMVEEGFMTMAIMNGTAQGERSWAEGFTKAYEHGGGEVVQQIEVEAGKASYQAELDRLFSADFDAWAVAIGMDDFITIAREWSNAGYGRQLLAEDALREQTLIDEAGDLIDGAYIGSPTGQGPAYDQFKQKYDAFSDDMPELHAWAVTCYDMVNVVALAIERAGDPSWEAIEKNLGPVTRDGGTVVSNFAEGRDALQNGEEINYQGAATPCDFTKYGNVLGDVGIEKVTPDGFEQVDIVTADEVADVVGEI